MRCLMIKMVVTWHVTTVGFMPVVWITKSENLWINSSFGPRVYSGGCMHLCCHRTKYMAWSLFHSLPSWWLWCIFSKLIYYTFCLSSCQLYSVNWASLPVFSTWVIQLMKDLSPFPSYVCKSAKKWLFLCWVCKSV